MIGRVTKTFIASVFPGGCKSYYGPHNLECISSIWRSSGCLDGGLGYPNDVSVQEEFNNSSLV